MSQLPSPKWHLLKRLCCLTNMTNLKMIRIVRIQTLSSPTQHLPQRPVWQQPVAAVQKSSGETAGCEWTPYELRVAPDMAKHCAHRSLTGALPPPPGPPLPACFFRMCCCNHIPTSCTSFPVPLPHPPSPMPSLSPCDCRLRGAALAQSFQPMCFMVSPLH